MPTYVVLYRFTDQGLKSIKGTVRRAREVTSPNYTPVTPWRPSPRPFHVLCVRNCMLDVDWAPKGRLVHLFHGHAEPGGYLFVGHSETLRSIDHPFRYLGPAIYRKD